MPRLTRPTPLTISLVAAFVVVTILMLLGATTDIDISILTWIGPTRDPALISLMRAFTKSGDATVEVPFALAVVALLWQLKRVSDAKRFFVAAVSGELLYVALKALIHRPRPTIIPHLAGAGWSSYPSGHAMLAPVIWSMALAFVARSVTQPALRALLMALAIIMPTGIAMSRVYLGVHYPTDVVGGALIGSAWMLWWWPSVSSLAGGSDVQGRRVTVS